MADDDRDQERLVEIPADGPDFEGIADEVDTADPGDLPRGMGSQADESKPGKKKRSTPMQGEVSFLRVEIPLQLYAALYQAWVARQEEIIRTEEEHRVPEAQRTPPLPETDEECLQRYIMEACGRDALLDESRALGEHQYNFTDWIGQSFAGVMRDYEAKKYDQTIRPALREQRDLWRERLQARHPDWSADDIEEELGPSGEEM